MFSFFKISNVFVVNEITLTFEIREHSTFSLCLELIQFSPYSGGFLALCYTMWFSCVSNVVVSSPPWDSYSGMVGQTNSVQNSPFQCLSRVVPRPVNSRPCDRHPLGQGERGPRWLATVPALGLVFMSPPSPFCSSLPCLYILLPLCPIDTLSIFLIILLPAHAPLLFHILSCGGGPGTRLFCRTTHNPYWDF